MTTEIVTLELVASDFKNNIYASNDCPIGRATKRIGLLDKPQVGKSAIWENALVYSLSSKRYKFDTYGPQDYISDQMKAQDVSDDTVIRTIKLERV